MRIHAVAQQHKRLSAQLGHSGLGHPKVLSNICHGVALKKVARDDDTETVGKRCNSRPQIRLELAFQDMVFRTAGLRIHDFL